MDSPSKEPSKETPWARARGIIARLVMAHIAAYAPMFVYAVALMPLVIVLNIKALEKLETKAEIGDYVVAHLFWPAAGAAAVAHLLSIPFILGGKKGAGHKLFLGGIVGLSAIGIVGGGIGWALFLAH